MLKTVTIPNVETSENFALDDYIHIFEEEDGMYSVYVTRSGETRSYGKHPSYKAALKAAKEIQNRHRFLILYQDYIGDVKRIYKPKLNAIGTGEQAKITSRRRPLKVKRIAI